MNQVIVNSRRQFLKGTCLGLGSLVLFSVLPKARANAAGVLETFISNNHGHAMAIDLAALQTNGARDYSIKGASGHDHVLQITDEILATLVQNRAVDVESTVGAGHIHVIRLQIL